MNKGEKEKIFTFDAYDTLGYLVPGLTTIIGIYLHCGFFGIKGPINELKAILPQWIVEGDFKWHESLIAITIILYVGYMIGHLVATLSSIIMDKLVVERIFGYPFERLFKGFLEPRPKDIEKNKRKFYRVALALFLAELIWIAAIGPYNRVSLCLVIAIAIFLLLKLGYTYLNQKDVRDSYDLRDVNDKQRKIAEWCWKYLVKWWLLKFSYVIFNSWAYFLLSLLRMRKPFNEEFRRKFVIKFEQVFDLKAKDVGTDVYWLTYSYLCQRRPACTKLLHKWLSQYGFARNLAISFFLLFVYGITMNAIYHPEGPYLAWCIVTGVTAVLFGLRYFYLYYNYYSKFVFRAFMSETINITGNEAEPG